MVELLLKNEKVDPSYNNNEAICEASAKGHIDIVKLLLQNVRVDPSYNNNEAIREAAKNCNYYVVNLLSQDKRVDPNANNYEAYYEAKNYAIKIHSIKIKKKSKRKKDVHIRKLARDKQIGSDK